jgi:hypothetical protein
MTRWNSATTKIQQDQTWRGTNNDTGTGTGTGTVFHQPSFC